MNDITPPKKTLSEAVAQADQMPVASADNVMPKKRRWPKALLGVLALVLVVAGYTGWQAYQRQSLWANVDGVIITKSFRNTIIKANQSLSQGQQQSQDQTSITKDSITTTDSDLILNAGLQKEADILGVRYDEATIDVANKEAYSEAGGKDKYYAKYKEQYGWAKEATFFYAQTDYLKKEISPKITADKKFVGVTVRWDRTRADKELASSKDAFESGIKENLEKNFKPLLEKGVNKEEVEKATDSYRASTGELNPLALYTTVATPSIYNEIEGLTDEGTFNDTFQTYNNEGESNFNVLSRLENKGDVSDVYKSSTGYFGVFRLEEVKPAKYASARALQESYKSKTKYYSVNPFQPLSSEPISIKSVINNALGIPTAEASTIGDCLTSQHQVEYGFTFKDVDNSSNYAWGARALGSGLRAKEVCDDRNYTRANDFGETKWSTATNIETTYSGYNFRRMNLDQKFYFGRGSAVIDCWGPGYDWSVVLPADWEYVSARWYNGTAWNAIDLSGGKKVNLKFASSDNGVKGKYKVEVSVRKKQIQKPKGQVWSLAKYKKTDGTYSNGWAFPNDKELTEDEKKKFFCLKGVDVQYSVRCSSDLKDGVAEPWKLWKDLDLGVYSAGIYGGLTDWVIDKVEIKYPAACAAHTTTTEVFASVGAVKVRVCENQTPTVVFYFSSPPSVTTTYGPWLQTLNGNVAALGDVWGAKIGGTGGRVASSVDKEAEYIVMGFVVRNFCSAKAYNFGLGADSGCSYDPGYQLNVPSADAIGTANDPIVKGIEAALARSSADENGCDSQRPYFVRSDITKRFQDDLGFGATEKCAVVGQIDSATFDDQHIFPQGRATIYVAKNLTINSNNIASYTQAYRYPNEVPNIGLIVKGNVTIAPDVTQLDFSIYATGKIKTCSVYPNKTCNKQLVVNGMLASGSGFEFGRNVTDGRPSEKIVGSGLLEAFPPPGFSDVFSRTLPSIKYITTNGNPRF